MAPDNVTPAKLGLLLVVKPLISACVGWAHTFPFFQNWLAAPEVLNAVAVLAFPVNAPVKLVDDMLVSPLIVVLSANVPVVSVKLELSVTADNALEVLKYARTSPLAKPESVKPVKVGLLPVVKPLISA